MSAGPIGPRRPLAVPAAGEEEARLLDLVGGMWTTQTVYAATELGVFDRLADGPADTDSLARELGCDASALGRLLRGLASLGLCRPCGAHRNVLTPLGHQLSSRHPRSLRAWALLAGRQQWRAWEGLVDTVRSGRDAARRRGDADRFARLDDAPAEAGDFHQAMAALTGIVADAVSPRLAALASAGSTVVDIGGGSGELLCGVLAEAPHLQGIVFDRPHAADRARQRLRAAGLAERARFVAGSFFDEVPAGDLLLLKSVLHDWDDDDGRRILARCVQALRPGGSVAIIERLLPETVLTAPGDRSRCRADLTMLVATGGRERSLDEMQALTASAGLAVERSLPAALDLSLLLCRRTARGAP